MIGPGEHILSASEIAEVFFQRQRMRQLLTGMGDRFHVDHRHRGVLREGLDHRVFAIDRPILELRKGTHRDQVHIAAQHARDFGDVFFRFAIHHRVRLELDRPCVFARRQHDGVTAKVKSAQLEAGARTHRRIEEQQGHRLAGKLLAARRTLERSGLFKQCVDLGAAVILGGDEMAKRHR